MTDAPAAGTRSETHHVWTTNEQVSGIDEFPAFLAGTPVAVLAGFNLATAFLVIGQRPLHDHGQTWAAWSAALLLVGATTFLATLALAARAQLRSIDPEQVHIWFPEMLVDEKRLKRVRELVWYSQALIRRLLSQALIMWTVGLALTAGGAALGVLSYGTDADHIFAASTFGAGAVVVAIMFNWKLTREPKGLEQKTKTELRDLNKASTDLILGRMPIPPYIAPPGQLSAQVTFPDGTSVIVTGVGDRSTERVKLVSGGVAVKPLTDGLAVHDDKGHDVTFTTRDPETRPGSKSGSSQ